ncbi:hypothetical protein H0E87_000005, partial [Populus deltoides]
MQEAADSDSSTDVLVQSVTGVGTGKKGITGQVKGTRLSNTSSTQVLRSSSKTARTLNLDQNQLQNSYSDFIRDLAEPQEVVDMELKERKRKKLRQIRRIGPKYTCIKRKKVKKTRLALANRGLADVAPNSYRNKYLKDNSSPPAIKSSSAKHADITSTHTSMDTETSDAHASLPSPLSSKCSQQASSESIKEIQENNRIARSKTRKLKVLQASGSVANTTEKGVSFDSLNSGIKQGNVRFEAAYKDNQADGFDRDKETREMLHDVAALGLGIYEDLIGYEEGVRGNIDREVDEWTLANQLNPWNVATVKWAFLESVGKSGGIIVMWDSSVFEVNSIEFWGQWISLSGKHVNSSFNCMVVGVYAASSMQDRAKLWEDITTLKFAFELPMEGSAAL